MTLAWARISSLLAPSLRLPLYARCEQRGRECTGSVIERKQDRREFFLITK